MTRRLGSRHLVERGANLFPLRFRQVTRGQLFEQLDHRSEWNLSEAALGYLRAVSTVDDATALFHHVIAVLHSPAYASENSGALRQDWPRIPMPARKDALLNSAKFGRRIAALLDTESGVDDVTTGTIVDPFRTIGTISHVGGKPLNPAEDLKVTAGWGHAGKGGVTMPGKGRIIQRDCSSEEREAIARGGKQAGLSIAQVLAHLGERTFDVYLNDVAYWKNIPACVWDYTMGGYQVIKKWLSYREFELLGRPLTPEEAREVMKIARRIAAIILMGPALDENYQAIKSAMYEWPSGEVGEKLQ